MNWSVIASVSEAIRAPVPVIASMMKSATSGGNQRGNLTMWLSYSMYARLPRRPSQG